jgi:hypothetical protein
VAERLRRLPSKQNIVGSNPTRRSNIKEVKVMTEVQYLDAIYNTLVVIKVSLYIMIGLLIGITLKR